MKTLRDGERVKGSDQSAKYLHSISRARDRNLITGDVVQRVRSDTGSDGDYSGGHEV